MNLKTTRGNNNKNDDNSDNKKKIIPPRNLQNVPSNTNPSRDGENSVTLEDNKENKVGNDENDENNNIGKNSLYNNDEESEELFDRHQNETPPA